MAYISEALSTADAGVRLLHHRNRPFGNALHPLFIKLGFRCVHLAGCTASPNTAWVTQQARQIVWHLSNEPQSIP